MAEARARDGDCVEGEREREREREDTGFQAAEKGSCQEQLSAVQSGPDLSPKPVDILLGDSKTDLESRVQLSTSLERTLVTVSAGGSMEQRENQVKSDDHSPQVSEQQDIYNAPTERGAEEIDSGLYYQNPAHPVQHTSNITSGDLRLANDSPTTSSPVTIPQSSPDFSAELSVSPYVHVKRNAADMSHLELPGLMYAKSTEYRHNQDLLRPAEVLLYV